MAEYERISAQIYGIYLRYVAPEDIHVYSIDECFIDCTGYLHAYRKDAERAGTNPARLLAITMIRDVLKTTGITATVGIGTNLYLAKVAMDIVAKKQPADKDGVRIAELNEDSYKFLLWDHKPLTDFWQIGIGKARRLEKAYLFTMGDIARKTQYDEEYFYKTFGIDGEILVDHAWGIEPVTMQDIKSYRSEGHSLSNGQVLPRPYKYQEAKLVFREMIEVLFTDMFSKNLVTQSCSWWVSFDYKRMYYPMKNNKMTKDTVPEGFSVVMALVDLLPVVFFGLSAVRVGRLFQSALFVTGALICLLSGVVKVLWKLIAAVSRRNIWPMFVQMRIFMPVGFLLLLAALIAGRAKLCSAAILAGICGFPACVFFALGALGMVCMCVFARRLDSSDPRANWLEQGVNALAQICIYIGLLLV